MNGERITVVDYGVGNLFSVRRALEHAGAREVVVSADLDDIESCGRLVLPGVGAFEDGMRGLRERGLVDPIVRFANLFDLFQIEQALAVFKCMDRHHTDRRFFSLNFHGRPNVLFIRGCHSGNL